MSTVSNLSTGDTITETYVDSVTNSINAVGCTVTRTANQSISNGTGTFTAISWDGEASDTNDFFTATSDTITVPTGYEGTYAITARLTWASSPGANSSIEVLHSSGAVFRQPVGSATQLTSCSICIIFPLAAADTIKIRVSQGSGGAINITGACYVWRLAL